MEASRLAEAGSPHLRLRCEELPRLLFRKFQGSQRRGVFLRKSLTLRYTLEFNYSRTLVEIKIFTNTKQMHNKKIPFRP